MKKQTVANNEFLAYVKKTYNKVSYQKTLVLVNEGKQELVQYMIESNLFWYVNGEKVAAKLMELKVDPKIDKSITELFEMAGEL